MKIHLRKETKIISIQADMRLHRIFADLYICETQGFSVSIYVEERLMLYIDEDLREYVVWATADEKKYIFDKIAEIEYNMSVRQEANYGKDNQETIPGSRRSEEYT